MSEFTENDVKLLRQWRRSMLRFVLDIIQPEEITGQQRVACEELSKIVNAKVDKSAGKKLTEKEEEYAIKRGISIMSGQGTGKNTWGAWAIIWFLCCFPYPKIPCTAVTGDQIAKNTWAEVHKWMRLSRKDEDGTPILEKWLVWQAEKISWKEAGGKEWFAFPKTANVKGSADEQAETLAGIHEDYMLIFADEATGIADPVFRPLEGTMTGKCNVSILIFNPTRSKGFAINTHTKERKYWVALHWDAEECERVSKDHIAFMEAKYGRDSNAFRIRVSGLPPKDDPGTLIPWDKIMDAVERETELDPNEGSILTVDVGAGGDDSSALHKQGHKVTRIKRFSSPDTMVSTGHVVREINDFDPVVTGIDNIGIGLGVYDRLRELGHKVRAVDVRTKSPQPDKFDRARDYWWWQLREDFMEDLIDIPNDDTLICELSVITYDIDSSGCVKIATKKQIKKDGAEVGVLSPNTADALMMQKAFPSGMYRKNKKQSDRYRRTDEDSGGTWMGQ